MSVTLEKRRKVAELENFERRIRQEKSRLLSELESLERPFRNAKATGWSKDFSRSAADGWRGFAAASFRAPMWFHVVAAIILLAVGGLVAHIALRGAPARRADGATLRQVETPTTPARIDQTTPAPVNEIAQAADVAHVAPDPAPSVSAAPDLAPPATPSAPPTPDAKDLKERLLEAQSAMAPLPEPLPPPTKADVAPAAPALRAGAVAELDQPPPQAVADAPPGDSAALQESDEAAPVTARESRRGDETANAGRHTKCLVKVDGHMLFERGCVLRQPSASTLNLTAGDDAVVLTRDHGRSWTASLGGRSLGKVYRTGDCWGRRREVYICAKGA